MGEQLRVTDTLYAGIQLILPGESAPLHRHSQSALRFVLEGRGATTTVDGELAPIQAISSSPRPWAGTHTTAATSR